MILMKLLILCSFLIFGAKKTELVIQLTKTCEKGLDKKMAWDKAQIACGCFKKEMEKLTVEELQHLVLADAGKSKESALPVDQGSLLENYKLEVAYKCMKQEPPQPKAKK